MPSASSLSLGSDLHVPLPYAIQALGENSMLWQKATDAYSNVCGSGLALENKTKHLRALLYQSIRSAIDSQLLVSPRLR
jgi:hypothetical protein